MGAYAKLIFSCLLLVPFASLQASQFDTTSAWLPEVEQLYRTDVHYSRDAACAALGRRLSAAQPEQPVSFVVRSADHDLRDDVQLRLNAQLAFEGQPSVVVDVAVQSAQDGKQTLFFYVPDWELECSTSFVSKAWVVRAPQQDYVTVRGLSSEDLLGESQDVIRQAMTSVILPRVREQLGKRGLSRRGEKVAMQRIQHAMDESFVVDRFRQTFYTSIDDEDHVALVREAVLLDLGTDNVDAIARPVAREMRRVNRRTTMVLGIAGIAIVVTILICRLGYAFLNRVTQGYYVWPIRFATATVLFLAVGAAATLTITILNSI